MVLYPLQRKNEKGEIEESLAKRIWPINSHQEDGISSQSKSPKQSPSQATKPPSYLTFPFDYLTLTFPT